MIQGRDTNTENTFIVLQEDDTEPLLKEEEALPINKIDKNKKKVNKGKGRGRIRKTQVERKGESQMRPKPELIRNNPMKGSKSGIVDP